MSETLAIAIITGVITLLASSGFWTFILKRSDNKNARTRLLIGLAHDRIMHLGYSFIQRGYITKEEYDDLRTYLYEPYKDAGGNGSAEKIMNEVHALPFYNPAYADEKKEEKNGAK